jgi:hypothetical protein
MLVIVMADSIRVKETKHRKGRLQEKGHESEGQTNSDDHDTTDDETQQAHSDNCKKSTCAYEDKHFQHGGHIKVSCNSLTVDAAVTRSVALCDDAPCRLLMVSSKIKNSSVMQSAILPNVVLFIYKYESSTLDTCLGEFLIDSNET